MSKNNDVKPCPYCGSPTSVRSWGRKRARRYSLVCMNEKCRARGPVSRKRAEAAMWGLMVKNVKSIFKLCEEKWVLQRMTKFLAAGAQPCLTEECPEGLNGECNRFSQRAIQCNLKYARLKAENETGVGYDDCY